MTDSASLELMLYLTVRLRTSQIALVGATRPPRLPAEGDNTVSSVAASRALSDLMRQGMLFFLPLTPLSTEATAQHLQTLLPGTISQSVTQALLTRAEGNPFLLEELVRALTRNQQLVLQDEVWKLVRTGKTILPESIALAVEERLQGFSETCHELLRIAALFGRTFPVDALVQVLGKSVDEVQSFIDEAVQASIIAKVPSGTEDRWEESNGQDDTRDMLENVLSEQSSLQVYIFCQGIVLERVSTTERLQNSPGSGNA